MGHKEPQTAGISDASSLLILVLVVKSADHEDKTIFMIDFFIINVPPTYVLVHLTSVFSYDDGSYSVWHI
jgi:hypothetical protein